MGGTRTLNKMSWTVVDPDKDGLFCTSYTASTCASSPKFIHDIISVGFVYTGKSERDTHSSLGTRQETLLGMMD